MSRMNGAQQYNLCLNLIQMIQNVVLSGSDKLMPPEPTNMTPPPLPTKPGEVDPYLDESQEQAIVNAMNDTISTFSRGDDFGAEEAPGEPEPRSPLDDYDYEDKIVEG